MRSESAAPLDQAAIAVLADRAAIADLGYQFLSALDTKQWARIADCCETEISVSWDDPAALPKSFSGCDATVEGLQSLFGRIVAHHQATNALSEIDGDRASLHWLVVGRYRAPTMRGDDWCTVRADQRMTLTRRGGRWRIRDILHSNLWVEGNPAVLQTASPPAGEIAAAKPLPDLTDDGTPEQRLARLTDSAAIYDVMMRFGRGLDRKDWSLYRSCFGKTLILDFSRMVGEPAQEVDADLFVEFARMRQRSHASFHQYSNFQAHVRGDGADCILYMVARHRVNESSQGDPLNVFVGWYENEFVRGPDGWKISVLRTPLQWVEGNALIKDKPDPAAEEITRRLFAAKETH